MTQLTRRNVLLLAAVMAAATTFVAYLFLTRQQVSARSRDDRNAVQTMVVVPRQEIRPLQLLRPEWFAVKQVKMDGVPRDAVATPADLKGKVALVTMSPGQYVTEGQVASKGPGARSRLHGDPAVPRRHRGAGPDHRRGRLPEAGQPRGRAGDLHHGLRDGDAHRAAGHRDPGARLRAAVEGGGPELRQDLRCAATADGDAVRAAG